MFTPLQLQNIEFIQVRDSPLVVTPIMMALQEKKYKGCWSFPPILLCSSNSYAKLMHIL